MRDALLDVWLGVDANQGYSLSSLDRLLPVLIETDVSLLEQPLLIGAEEQLRAVTYPIPIAAEESIQGLDDLERLCEFFQVVNIKLDKYGGVTEALQMVMRARQLGMDVMIGNMLGTSLSTTPAWLVGQLCDIADLDGSALLAKDREPCTIYSDGEVSVDETAWG